MAASVEILLATYNGADHLDRMLDSLLAQSQSDFKLRVRDDGSKDGTCKILKTYAPRFEGRLQMMETDAPSGSAKGNFAKLMEASEGHYLLFADQDDVWTPNHVAELTKLLVEAEADVGKDTPVYAFTDVTPVDAALNPLAESFFAFKGIDPSLARRVNQLIVCPPMLGCASGINRSLRELALPIPVDRVTGHDWWALLLAAAAGHCVWSYRSTVLYRLHGGNVSSQVASDLRVYAKMSNKTAKVQRGMMLRRLQADAVRERLVDMVDEDKLTVFDDFGRLMDAGYLQRRIGLISGGYLYPDVTRNFGMLAFC